MGMLGLFVVGGAAWVLQLAPGRTVPRAVGMTAPPFRAVSTRESVAFSGRGPAILYFYEADT